MFTVPLPLGVVSKDKSGFDEEAAMLLRPSLELFLLPRPPDLFANGSNFYKQKEKTRVSVEDVCG